jgi:tetratricopeptide (TPR) repeat protein
MGSARGMYNLGVQEQEACNYGQAAHWYQRAIVLDPACADAHNNLGIIATIEGNGPKAIEHFQTAIGYGHEKAAFNLNYLPQLLEAEPELPPHSVNPTIAPQKPLTWNNMSDSGVAKDVMPDVAQAPATRFCTECGTSRSQPEAQFCGNCGKQQ